LQELELWDKNPHIQPGAVEIDAPRSPICQACKSVANVTLGVHVILWRATTFKRCGHAKHAVAHRYSTASTEVSGGIARSIRIM